MTRRTNTFTAIIIVVAEVVSIGMASNPASAQNVAQERQQIRQQQQLILKQQRLIQQNQHQLQTQHAQIARQPSLVIEETNGADQNRPRGLFGSLPSCPPFQHYNLFWGCL